mmetsp:Transcript_19997/g.28458  ORF Transcript_19997/g.28458 Transcript_19997/m.28458 type:complete len:266 (+) Transcript_19997:76-873(+)
MKNKRNNEDNSIQKTKVKKRKQAAIMGAGETLNVTSGSIQDLEQDHHHHNKKEGNQYDNSESSSFWEIVGSDDDVNNKISNNAITIAERITALQQQTFTLQPNDKDGLNDEKYLSEDDCDSIAIKSKKKSVATTSDSLIVIVKQALQSSNELQLEEAFSVYEETVVKDTIASITDVDLIWTLLLKIIHRISKKPSRAVWLGGVWLKTILEYHSSAFLKFSEEEGSSLVYKVLGPLANMLKERTELLPHLIKLQGRLDMVSRRHGI